MSRVPLLLGTMTMGAAGIDGVRVHDLSECQKLLDIYLSNYKELDTARVYAEGTTEEYLSKLDIKGATVDTKIKPSKPGDHAPEALRSAFKASLEALSPHNVRVLYLHAPDRSVPFEDTVREVDRLHKEGLFQIFGLSNFAAWEVAEIAVLCREKGLIQPKIYQGMYNAITRDCERELLPCLRKFGLRGGLFAGRISPSDYPPLEGRFSGAGNLATMYRERYFRDSYFEALESLKPLAVKYDLRLTEIALRWCQHHSLLTPRDGVILGASSAAQLEQNIVDGEKGPLPEEIVTALEEAWMKAKPMSPAYWR